MLQKNKNLILIEGKKCKYITKGIWEVNEKLHWKVKTCFEAAITRNIFLHEELKTLVYRINNKIIAFHLPGDRKVSFNKLGLRTVHKKPLEKFQLEKYGLAQGKINPLNIRHIKNLDCVYICKKIFDTQFLYTNNGELDGTYIIEPSCLRKMYKKTIIQDYSMDFDSHLKNKIIYD